MGPPSPGRRRPTRRGQRRRVRRVEAAAPGERRAAPRERDPQERVGFLRGRARPATATLVTYIDEHKHLFGVEPICQALTSFGWPIASSTYRAACRRLPSVRSRRDAWL